jgi:hypothetical protein
MSREAWQWALPFRRRRRIVAMTDPSIIRFREREQRERERARLAEEQQRKARQRVPQNRDSERLRDSNLNGRSLVRKLYALGTFKCAKHSFSDKRKS